MARTPWLTRLSYLYLALPFVLFCFGWFKLPVSLAVLGVLTLVLYRILRSQPAEESVPGAFAKTTMLGLAILGLWVLLSGIGGYTFQNHDSHWRNAIFRDLITYDWPVFYPVSAQLAGTQPRELVYYIGYWLPSALMGKLFGLNFANLSLFLWTWLGVFLVARQISYRLRASLIYGALLLIFFSGMDALGVLSVRSLYPQGYPSLWPPTQHLEWWPFLFQFQYSSFTTQLFWVFNQALPCWVGLILLINGVSRRHVFFLWSLCFFFSPLPALGMIPFVALEVTQPRWSLTKDGLPIWKKIWNFIQPPLCRITEMFSLENIIGGGAVVFLSTQYFKTNRMSQATLIHGYPDFGMVLLIFFTLFEWGILWLLLLPQQKKNIFWYLVGLILALAPFIQVGMSQDFEMRASIPALFYMMVLCGESLRQKKGGLIHVLVLVCLIIGALTPLFEINRSVYRSISYYTCNGISLFIPCPYIGIPNTDVNAAYQPETDHLHSLVADDLKSLGNLPNGEGSNFLTVPMNSFPGSLLLKSRPISR